jgi:hypothetical protein
MIGAVIGLSGGSAFRLFSWIPGFLSENILID